MVRLCLCSEGSYRHEGAQAASVTLLCLAAQGGLLGRCPFWLYFHKSRKHRACRVLMTWLGLLSPPRQAHRTSSLGPPGSPGLLNHQWRAVTLIVHAEQR